eukprot:4065082-Amphidinium_carterae.1
MISRFSLQQCGEMLPGEKGLSEIDMKGIAATDSESVLSNLTSHKDLIQCAHVVHACELAVVHLPQD